MHTQLAQLGPPEQVCNQKWGQSEFRTIKTQLVREYALVMNRGDVDETSDSLFREAVRYLQVCLLADLRPPWADYRFPQALPGDGTLSRYTRPCFLRAFRGEASEAIWHVAKAFRGSEGAC